MLYDPRHAGSLLTGTLAAALLFALAVPGSAPAACAGASSDPDPSRLEPTAAAVACRINAERRERGLPRLAPHRRLAVAARRYAREMVRGAFFSHVGIGGTTMTERLRAVGYVDGRVTWAVGETLAWGTGPRARPGSIVGAWMDSPRHRRILLDPRYRDVGVGVAIGNPVGAEPAPGATYAAELGYVSS
jgi:uncharacterized protein YkwD